MDKKLKIALASDLHLEFGDIVLTNTEDADVLILSGDIMIASDLHDHPEPEVPYTPEIIKLLGSRQVAAQRYRDFLKRVSNEFPHVIYIAGNHEYYHGNFPGSQKDLRNECAKFSNVYFLENDTKEIDGVIFVGSTLWTDMNNQDPLTTYHIEHSMNDFRLIRMDQKNYRRFKPNDAIIQHVKSKGYIAEVVKSDPNRTYVVVGHHAPTTASVKPGYEGDYLMNGGYHSDLSEFILDHQQIKVWTHGHTHSRHDYMVGTTRVVCNPRGYVGYEACAANFSLMYLEV